MGMDTKELKFMHSPFKRLMQKHLELRIFKHFLSSLNLDLTGKILLEVGCGSGYGLELISKEFQPAELFAFDLLPEEVALARQKSERANVFVGDVRAINLPSEKFDAIFIFTVFHHVEGWQQALKEVNRVLKVGGILLVNELNRQAVNRFERFIRTRHPRHSRFDWAEFKHGLASAGFNILREKRILNDFGFFLCLKR
jgi:ubiquinone/menaquinone biosynthesis C-methylase UbiE